jgi:hypothetical protein
MPRWSPSLSVLGALGVVGLTWLALRKPTAPSTGGFFASGTPGVEGASLTKGQLYRVKLRAKRASDAKALGFSPVILAYADPTEPSQWTLLARWTGARAPGPVPGAVVLSAEAVEEPPKPSAREQVPGLDADLLHEEVEILRHALAEDDDPKHLGGIAASFEPDFPVAAALLRAKAVLTLAGKQRTKRCAACGRQARFESPEQLQSCSDACAENMKKGDVPSYEITLVALEKASSGLGPSVVEMWRKFQPALEGLGARVVPAREPPPSASEVVPDPDALRKVLAALVKDVSLMVKSPEELSKELGVVEGIVKLAKSLVMVLPGGIALVRPALKLPRPVTPPSALVLAHAAMRPTLSRVAKPKKIGTRLRDIRSEAKAGDLQGVMALEMLQRAEKAIDRRKWVDWHKRFKKAEEAESTGKAPDDQKTNVRDTLPSESEPA